MAQKTGLWNECQSQRIKEHHRGKILKISEIDTTKQD